MIATQRKTNTTKMPITEPCIKLKESIFSSHGTSACADLTPASILTYAIELGREVVRLESEVISQKAAKTQVKNFTKNGPSSEYENRYKLSARI